MTVALLDASGAPIRAPDVTPALITGYNKYQGMRATPPVWQERLESVVPRNEKLSWLYIRWEPGDLWEPINRWVIWQIRPIEATRIEYVIALKGPSPRSTGHYCAAGYCACPRKRNYWVDGPSSARFIDKATWDVFHETGGYGTRWWAIQGPNGGHRYRLDKWEAKVARIHGFPPDTPAIGDLPYAEFDERVIEHIVKYDNVRQWKHCMEYAQQHPNKLDEIERDGAIRAQEELWKWMETQAAFRVDSMTKAEANALRDHARDMTPVGAHIGQPRLPEDDPEHIHQSFIYDHPDIQTTE